MNNIYHDNFFMWTYVDSHEIPHINSTTAITPSLPSLTQQSTEFLHNTQNYQFMSWYKHNTKNNNDITSFITLFAPQYNSIPYIRLDFSALMILPPLDLTAISN